MATSEPIIFYDIASGPPAACRTFAPNPSKTRYALNLKGVKYKTQWVDLPDIPFVRKGLNCAAVRFFNDGSPYYTLPMIQDPSTGAVIGDTFDIALYLDKMYPDHPPLMPPSTIGVHKAFNTHVDALFSQYTQLFVHDMPLNPETAEQTKAEFVRRGFSTAKSWDELGVEGEARRQKLEEFKAALGELKECFKYSDGPFIGGEKASYADIIVGGWLACFKATCKDWDVIQGWHGGVWGKLNEALEVYFEIK